MRFFSSWKKKPYITYSRSIHIRRQNSNVFVCWVIRCPELIPKRHCALTHREAPQVLETWRVSLPYMNFRSIFRNTGWGRKDKDKLEESPERSMCTGPSASRSVVLTPSETWIWAPSIPLLTYQRNTYVHNDLHEYAATKTFLPNIFLRLFLCCLYVCKVCVWMTVFDPK